MAKLATILLSVLMTTPAFALVRDWNGLLDAAAASENQLDTPYGTYRYLQHIDPADTDQPHRAEYFSVVGGFDANGVFLMDHVEVVSEVWTLDAAGAWKIDQWGFTVAIDGTVTFSMHNDLNIERGGRVLEHRSIPTTPEEFAAHWQTLLLDWQSGFASR